MTCDPEFYKHTQRLFLLLHERGLAYQAESMVNYDPIDKTVLANEQVDSNGLSWRSGAKVEKKLLKQWFLKISKFREELLEHLEFLSKDAAWPERILAMQKNWLGRSKGARIKFPVKALDQQTYADIEVFTTRPDTLFGVQYIALSSTHPIVEGLAKSDPDLQTFLDSIPTLPQDSKAGYFLSHVQAVNPMSYEESTMHANKDPLPVYVAPYVLGDYGDGAVMGVPGHDTRDHAFWKHNRPGDQIRMVVHPSNKSELVEDQPFIYQGLLTTQSGPYVGQSSEEGSKNIIKFLQSKDLGTSSESWRLRDWLISRQRYWGTPIPIIHCDSCGAVPVPEHLLPVKLPSVDAHWAKGKAGNPLEDAHDWINTPCPKCHEPAKRDTDTMDTFVDSSWYFMRFIDPHNKDHLFSSERANQLLPVDVYIGGVEHAILHLLYARFISKFLASIGMWESSNHGEPFKKVLAQGMVHGKTYKDPTNGRFLKPDEVDLKNPANPIIVATGETPSISFEKMSKSKYNGVAPSDCFEKYGADATRAHILFQAPVSEVLYWDEAKISGIVRWFKRISGHIELHPSLAPGVAKSELIHTPKTILSSLSKLCNSDLSGPSDSPGNSTLDLESFDQIELKKIYAANFKLWKAVQETIESVTKSYGETFALNTVVSDLMTLTNALFEHEAYIKQWYLNSEPVRNISQVLQSHSLDAIIQMMAPITPGFSEKCWAQLYSEGRPLPDGEAAASNKSKLHSPKHLFASKAPSVFDHPFPVQDGTITTLSAQSIKCVVQVNGKMKALVEISIPANDLMGQELEEWIVKEISRTTEGAKLHEKFDLSSANKVILVKRGKVVNFVI